jgi:signal peptidase I
MKRAMAMIAERAVRVASSLVGGVKSALALIAGISVRVADMLIRGTKIAMALIARVSVRVAKSLTTGTKKVPALTTKIAVRTAHMFSLRGIIQRTVLMIGIVAVCVIGFLAIRGTMPFMAIFGISMEPELDAGDLILIEEVSPYDIKEGDIIVFTIPQAVREFYNYPQVIAHRVKEVRESESGVTFRTKGDNTGEDPFTVRPQDIKGQVSKQIPYLGFPLLFFQSQQGLIFLVVALLLLALYLYSDEIGRGRQIVHKSIFAPIIEQNRETSQALEQRLEVTEKGMAGTQQALTSFASAIAEYAEHLKSHTSAIQGLSEASQELKKGAAEQNKVLARLVETMEQMSPKPEIEEPEPEVEVTFPPGCIRSRRQTAEEEDILEAG